MAPATSLWTALKMVFLLLQRQTPSALGNFHSRADFFLTWASFTPEFDLKLDKILQYDLVQFGLVCRAADLLCTQALMQTWHCRQVFLVLTLSSTKCCRLQILPATRRWFDFPRYGFSLSWGICLARVTILTMHHVGIDEWQDWNLSRD